MIVLRTLLGVSLAWVLLGLGGASDRTGSDVFDTTTQPTPTENSPVVAATPSAPPRRIILVGGDHNYPPYSYLENGNPTGFNIELIQAIARTMDFEIEVRLAPWSQARRQLEQGEIDMLVGMYYSEERAASVDFSLPHSHVASGLFVRVDSAVKDFEDARGLSILVRQNDIMHDYLKQTAFTPNIFAVPDSFDALRALAAGQYDAALLSSQAQGWHFINRFNLTNLRVVETGIPPLQYCFAVQKGDDELLHTLNEGLNLLHTTGEYREISERWFRVYEQRDLWQTLRYYVGGLAAAAVLLLGSLAWSWSLHVQVRRRTEALSASEDKFAKAFLASPVALTINRLADGRYLEVNESFAQLAGCPREEVVGKTYPELEVWASPAERIRIVNMLLKDGKVDNLEVEYRAKDGSIRVHLYSARLIELKGETCVLAIARDISARKQAETQIVESKRRLDTLINNLRGFAYRCQNNPEWAMEYLSEGCLDITGYTSIELTGSNSSRFSKLICETDRAFVWDEIQKALQQNKSYVLEYSIRSRSGEEKALWEKGRGVYDPQGDLMALEGYITDITERKRAEEKLQRQLSHLQALRAIDQAIVASADLRLTLRALLDEVIDQLDADACAVLLTRPQSLRLEYAAQQGFRSVQLKEQTFLFGEGYAGTAALNRQPVYVADLQAQPQEGGMAQLAAEGFAAYYAMPLIAKGAVTGVLEIFKRKPFTIDAEWEDFLQSLTAQAAIAIDNAALFENLQRSTIELSLAYDATIEGWSRALELRDHETEGHSQRVVDLTLKVARAMGMDDQELVQVRRGALLHDIGKMGIPDSILLKPGPLTPDEWKIMKKHPLMAEHMLRSVAFLRPALDIPLCHHERWDGSGYPHQLKGEQIPLAARIFAVIDVWDALQHDRPYRKAWDEEKIWDHFQEQSGKHFDPQVVEHFLAIAKRA